MNFIQFSITQRSGQWHSLYSATLPYCHFCGQRTLPIRSAEIRPAGYTLTQVVVADVVPPSSLVPVTGGLIVVHGVQAVHLLQEGRCNGTCTSCNSVCSTYSESGQYVLTCEL